VDLYIHVLTREHALPPLLPCIWDIAANKFLVPCRHGFHLHPLPFVPFHLMFVPCAWCPTMSWRTGRACHAPHQGPGCPAL